MIDRNLEVSFNEQSHEQPSIGMILTLESFLWSLARVNLVKLSDSIAANDCSVQRTYLVQDTPLETSYRIPQHTVANLIISEQQANFRGGNIRLEEIG